MTRRIEENVEITIAAEEIARENAVMNDSQMCIVAQRPETTYSKESNL